MGIICTTGTHPRRPVIITFWEATCGGGLRRVACGRCNKRDRRDLTEGATAAEASRYIFSIRVQLFLAMGSARSVDCDALHIPRAVDHATIQRRLSAMLVSSSVLAGTWV